MVRLTRLLARMEPSQPLANRLIPPADALTLVRAHAFADGVTLADVADDVVTRRLDLRDPGR